MVCKDLISSLYSSNRQSKDEYSILTTIINWAKKISNQHNLELITAMLDLLIYMLNENNNILLSLLNSSLFDPIIDICLVIFILDKNYDCGSLYELLGLFTWYLGKNLNR